MSRTLLPRKQMPPGWFGRGMSSLVSGLLALAAVGLIAFGISMIYIPAGVIAAGLGAAVLQWQFFGGN